MLWAMVLLVTLWRIPCACGGKRELVEQADSSIGILRGNCAYVVAFKAKLASKIVWVTDEGSRWRIQDNEPEGAVRDGSG